MSFSDDYSRVLEKAQREQERRAGQRTASWFGLRGVLWLFLRQWKYLLWTTSLVSLQVVEVAILAWVHYVYLSAGSLEFLRIVSSVSLFGILSVVAVKSLPLERLAGTVRNTGERQRIRVLQLGKLLFLAVALICAGIAFYIVQFTTLHFTAPPAFRAVLMAGLISLPFDVLSTFLFYHLRYFPQATLRKPYRLISIGFYILSLGFLYLDIPLAFLVCNVLPRFILIRALWRQTARESWLRIFVLKIRKLSDAYLYIHRFLPRLFWIALGLALLEASLYIVFSAVSRESPDAGLLIYFAHKICHVTLILGAKTVLILFNQSQLYRRARFSRGILRIQRQVWIGFLVYAAIATGLLPLLLMKRNVVGWASPVGETFQLSGTLMLALIVIVVIRSLALVHCLWLVNIPKRVWGWLGRFLPVVSVYIAVRIAQWSAGELEQGKVEDVFLQVLWWDGVTHLVIGVLLAFAMFQKAPPIAGGPSLRELVGRGRRREGALLWIRFWPKTDFATTDSYHHASIRNVLGATVLPLHQRTAVAFFESTSENDARYRLLESFGAVIEEVYEGNDVLRWYEFTIGRKSPDAGGKQGKEWANIISAGKVPEGCMSLSRRSKRWPLEGFNDEEIQTKAASFVARIESKNDWIPSLRAGDKGFLYWRDSTGERLFYVFPEKRNFFDQYRFRCFLQSVCGGGA